MVISWRLCDNQPEVLPNPQEGVFHITMFRYLSPFEIKTPNADLSCMTFKNKKVQ